MIKNVRKTKTMILIGMLILTAFFSVGNAATYKPIESDELKNERDCLENPYVDPEQIEPCPYEIVVEKTVWNGQEWTDSTEVHLGDIVQFKAYIYNPNEYDIDWSGTIYDKLPDNLRYINGSSTIPADIEKYIVEENTVGWREIPSIPPGETLSFTYETTAVDCGEGINNLTAEAHVIVGSNKIPISDYDTVRVNVNCEPQIEVDIEKFVWNGQEWTNYADFEIGDNINFKVIIYNLNDDYLMHFSGNVFDQLPDNIRYVNGSSTIYEDPDGPDWPNVEVVDWENNTVIWYKPPSILPNENHVFYYNATAFDCGIGENNVTAHPEGFTPYPVDYVEGEITNDNGLYNVSDQVTINVICEPDIPDISVEKYVREDECGKYKKLVEAEIEDYVTFKLYVNNTGETDLNIYVEDTIPEGLVYTPGYAAPREPDGMIGNIIYWNFEDVEPGESIVITFRATVVDCGELVNIVDVAGVFEQQEVVDSDYATVLVECPPDTPDVSVEKQVKIGYEDTSVESLDVDINGVFVFEITVENTGDVTLDINVTDFMSESLEYNNNALVDGNPEEPVFIDDHFTWVIDDVEPGQIVVITFEAFSGICGTFENLVEVTGFYEETTIADSDTATVNVYANPEIEIIKTADITTAEVGDTITYTYEVTNNGDVTLTDVSVVDDLLGPVTLGATILEAGDSTTGALSYTVLENDLPGPIYNVATATGYPPCECQNDPVTDTDDQTVGLIYNMDIDVQKYVREDSCGDYYDEITIGLGTYVTFKIVVENTGDVDLDVVLTDDLPADVVFIEGSMLVDDESVTPVWADEDTFTVDLGILQPGDVVIITFEAEMQQCGDYINTATATGTYNQETASDSDDATVNIPCDSSFSKKVKDPTTGEWVEQITTYTDHTIKFKLIFNYYGSEELLYADIIDKLPNIFIFDEQDFSSNKDTSVEYVVEGEEKTITFHLEETLSEGQTWWIEFEVTVNDVTGETPEINKAWIYAYNMQEEQIYDSYDEAKVISYENQAPTATIISGDTTGYEDEEVSFNIELVDPEGDDISFYSVDFGDNTADDYLYTETMIPSGTTVTVKHTYTENGTYNVKARAKDIYENLGVFGNIHTVEITKQQPTANLTVDYYKIFYFKTMILKVENTGTTDYSNLKWNMTIKSTGLLQKINSTTNGTINSLESGNSSYIISEAIRGLGRIQIKAYITNQEDEVLATTTINGFMLGRLIIIF